MLDNSNILITGATGSFGKKAVEIILQRYKPRRLIVFSRDELKQYEMRRVFSPEVHPFLRYFIGDVRDKERLQRALDGVDYVIHAAALKQIPAAEYNPIEAIKTNILGTANVLEASLDCGVKRMILLSTDKAANPINLYGATKLCADKLVIAGNSYSGQNKQSIFSVVRYGNVMGSRGSVIPFFVSRAARGLSLPVTDKRMTRFWMTIEQGVEFVLNSLKIMKGGEIFVPKIPSCRILDLAAAIGPDNPVEIIGIRPGEKLHETLISMEDATNTIEMESFYIIIPSVLSQKTYNLYSEIGKKCPEGFTYNSAENTMYLNSEEMRALLKKEKML